MSRSSSIVLCLVVALAMAVMTVGSPSAAAGQQTRAICSFKVHMFAEPGWTMTPGSGRGGSVSLGSLTCIGTVDGSEISDEAGSYFVSYFTYGGTALTAPMGGDTCALTAGEGRVEMTISTVEGRTVSLEGPFEWTAVGLAFTAQGTAGGVPVKVVALTIPEPDALDQNCVTKPFSRYIDAGSVVLGT